MFEASPYFWFALGVFVTMAAYHLIGEWLVWRGNVRFEDDRDAAERRIASLPPVSDPADDFIPARWPLRRKVR